jgi:hypothetical protein
VDLKEVARGAAAGELRVQKGHREHDQLAMARCGGRMAGGRASGSKLQVAQARWAGGRVPSSNLTTRSWWVAWPAVMN